MMEKWLQVIAYFRYGNLNRLLHQGKPGHMQDPKHISGVRPANHRDTKVQVNNPKYYHTPQFSFHVPCSFPFLFSMIGG